ncbi:hypothetical protein GQ43DRAFT_306242 [Delitschia confertaspora ATCC 74209]|uniref:Uncharacterized protein n=1 Tax=Delitschia confertaspora ATCC 74209 TaxID=1513339 RepID=A0A9P4JU17_9PLEO|nr:hypothetical protein GQ43DRAFT_306242 [Delitschia confertaspora ATCC 74209]
MRVSTASSLLLPALCAAHAVLPPPSEASTPALATATPTVALTETLSRPTADSIQTPNPSPVPTLIPILAAPEQPENLDLRAIIENPNAPAIPKTPTDSVTVQWVETMIKGVKTWVPVTVTVRFEAVPSQFPQPGKGVIGMGTLTGKTGVTKTINAAPGETGVWRRGLGVAVGVVAVGQLVV